MKSEEIIDKAIQKAYKNQENKTDTNLITISFVEGLAKTHIEGLDEVDKHDKEWSQENKLAINFLGFKSFKDMYLLALSNQQKELGVTSGIPITIKYFNNDLDLLIPEQVSKATMSNSMNQVGNSEDNQGTQITNDITVLYTGDEEVDITALKVPNSLKEFSIHAGYYSNSRGSQKLLYYKDGTLYGIACLLKQSEDTYILTGWGSNDNIEVKVVSDLVVKAIQHDLKIVLDATLFSDVVPPFLVGLGYSKIKDTVYEYDSKKFPEYLKVVIQRDF